MNILQKSALRQAQWTAMMAQEYGYETFTTFYGDLTIAELVSGIKGVKDTFKSVVKSWLNNYKYFTEFVMALNPKSWEHAETDPVLAQTYADLYYQADDLFYKHYEDNDTAKSYYFQVTD